MSTLPTVAVNPKAMWKGIDSDDRYMILGSILIPIAFWWIYKGRHKYGTKGMR